MKGLFKFIKQAFNTFLEFENKIKLVNDFYSNELKQQDYKDFYYQSFGYIPYSSLDYQYRCSIEVIENFAKAVKKLSEAGSLSSQAFSNFGYSLLINKDIEALKQSYNTQIKEEIF